MSNLKDPFGELKRLVKENPDRITILEEEIDVKLQMEYFRFSREAKKESHLPDVGELVSSLLEPTGDLDSKKKLLASLASINDVAAFRAIESYKNDPSPELAKWAILAFQESRMLISSKILDESPVYISTGLGGRDRKLRYSIGIASCGNDDFTDFQKRIIASEMDFSFKNRNSEIEETSFYCNVAVFGVLIPIDVDLRELMKSAIKAVNQFGSFLRESFMITNMHKISPQQASIDLLNNDKVPLDDELNNTFDDEE
jgi:hypothetical protein